MFYSPSTRGICEYNYYNLATFSFNVIYSRVHKVNSVYHFCYSKYIQPVFFHFYKIVIMKLRKVINTFWHFLWCGLIAFINKWKDFMIFRANAAKATVANSASSDIHIQFNAASVSLQTRTDKHTEILQCNEIRLQQTKMQ